jgi:hypothetical protein
MAEAGSRSRPRPFFGAQWPRPSQVGYAKRQRPARLILALRSRPSIISPRLIAAAVTGVPVHPPGGHDDIANAVCGLVSRLVIQGTVNYDSMGFDDCNEPDPEDARVRRFKSMITGMCAENGLWPTF